MLQGLVKILSPLSLSELQDVRYRILQDMQQKKFSYYLGQINTVRKKVIDVLTRNHDADFLDDNLWTTGENALFSSNAEWWTQETSWLAMKYPKLYPTSSGTSPLVKQMLSDGAVEALIGDSPWFTPQQVLFFKSLITTYYKNNKKLWPVILNIDASYLQYSQTDASVQAAGGARKRMLIVLKYALSGSGPFMLKILQQLSNSVDTRNDEASELTSTVFDSVPPLTAREYDLVLRSLNLSSAYVDNAARKPLGSASLAETHVTKDRWDKPVILKMLRPMYAYYFMCECDYLLCETWKMIGKMGRSGKYETTSKDLLVKQSRQLLLFLLKEYAVEFDYQREAWFNVIGYKHYNQPSQHVRSAQVLQSSVDPFPVMIQTMAGEASLKSILDRLLKMDQTTQMTVAPLLYGTMKKLLNLWLKTAFWTEDAFFHGDLHAGNLMTLSLEKLLRRADKGEEFAPIWIIDYGSSGVFSERTKCKMLTAMLQTGKLQDMLKWIPAADAPPPEPYSEGKDENVTSFFLDFDTLTAAQQTGLRRALQTPEARSMHAENLKQIKIFVRRVWSLCQVRDRTPEHMSSFYKRLLNYSSPFEFGRLFLSLAKYGRDIGLCTSNPVIMFGRGVAYLKDNLTILEKMCNNPEKYPTYNSDSFITRQLMKHPTQMVNFLRGKKICKA